MATNPPRLGPRSGVSPRRADGSRGRSGTRIGPVRVTPIRAALGIALIGSLAYIAVAILVVNDSNQLPMVTAGVAVLGLVFAALSMGGAIRMWRAWQDGAQGQTVFFALAGGIAGTIAIGCFAVALVFALVTRA
jgi:hypothetical protein